MGVIYKLKPEIVKFITTRKKSNPNIGCRTLSSEIKEKFKIHVSKSAVNKIIKDQGLSNHVGRPGKAQLSTEGSVLHCGFFFIKAIAEYLGISERTLIRRYADETGQTVKARVLSLRMEKACILLRSTPLPLSDIAAQCGFQYVNHFIRAFHQYMGQTPRTYRLAGQQKET